MAPNWPEFQGIVQSLARQVLYDEPNSVDENAAALIEVDRGLGDAPAEQAAIEVALITDLYANLAHPGPLRRGTDYLDRLEESVPGMRDEPSGRLRQWQNAVAGIARRLNTLDPAFVAARSGALMRALDNSEPRRHQGLAALPQAAPTMTVAMPAGRFQMVHARRQLSSGDLVFREMNVPFFAIFRAFGHAGVYVGVAQDGALRGQHVVVEMQMTLGGGKCHVVGLHEFAGAGSYWGGYSVDLGAAERYQVVVGALSYVGVAKYGFVDYKDAPAAKFRCDGLPEHAYEQLKPMPAGLRHRGGLFEDDLWSTMSPASLRNCMFEKVP